MLYSKLKREQMKSVLGTYLLACFDVAKLVGTVLI